MEKIIDSVQVPAPIESNNTIHMINKEENTMKKLSVAIVLDNKAYTKKYDEPTAFGIYKTLTDSGEVAILSDENGFFQTNCAELPEYKRVYGDVANAKLNAVQNLYEKNLQHAETCRKSEEDPLAEKLRLLHRDARNKMKKKYSLCAMRHYDLLTGECETTLEFSNALYRKVKSLGYSPKDVFVYLKTEIPEVIKTSDLELRRKIVNANAKLNEIATNGLLFEGRKYKELFASAKSTVLFVREDLYESLNDWLMCGLDSDTIADSDKRDAYSDQTASAFRPFSSKFSRPLDPNRVAIIPDKYVTVQSTEMNAFNGMGTFRYKHFWEINAFTMRSFWINALVFPSDFDAVCEKLDANKLVDVWGNEHNIEDLDVILTASCFKMWKQYASWDEYVKHLNSRNAEFCLRAAGLCTPYRPVSDLQGHAQLGDVNDAERFANKTKSVLDSYKDKWLAINLLPAPMRYVVDKYPEMLSHWFVNNTLQDCYASRRNEALGGKMLYAGFVNFNAPDMVAFWQHILGLKGEGILHAGQCLHPHARYREMDVTLNPNSNNAHISFFNARSKLDEGYEPFFIAPAVYFNMYDLIAIRQRADHDSDHVFWSQDHDLINLVHKSATVKAKNTNSFLDSYTYFVKENVPSKLEVENIERMNFYVNCLLKNPLCEVIPGLLGTGRYNKNTGKLEGEGLFTSIAFRFAKNRENVEDSANKEALVKTLNNARYAKAYLELEKFATQNGYTMFDVCDNVTRWIFGTENIQKDMKFAKVLYDMYFGVFGDMVASIVDHNKFGLMW